MRNLRCRFSAVNRKSVIELIVYICLVIFGILALFTSKPEVLKTTVPQDFQLETGGSEDAAVYDK